MSIKNSISVLIFFFLAGGLKFSSAFQGPVQDIFMVMQSDDTAKINGQLAALEKSSAKEKDAYKGALLMKKSGLEKSGLDKLSFFKKGKLLLEGSIKQDSSNAEYRFLRLIIQEHVPDFLNYHSKKNEDAMLIRKAFPKMKPDLQQAILGYSKKSEFLKPEDFQK